MATKATSCGVGLMRCICGVSEAGPGQQPLPAPAAARPEEPAAQLKSAAPPPLEGVPPCRDDDSTAAPTLEEASRPTTPLGAAAEAAEAAEAAGRALLECPWHDALAFFLATRDLGRCSQASPGLLRELTVESVAPQPDGSSQIRRLLLAPAVELKMENAEAELRRVSIPHIHVLRVHQRLSFDAVVQAVKSTGKLGLRCLDKFVCNDCPMYDSDVRSLLAPTLAGVPRLKLLNLEKNRINDAFLQQLCRTGLVGRLDTLNLRFNQVGDAGATALANCAGARSLRWVNLKMNRVGEKGCEALASLLRRSGTMTLLNLRKQTPGISDKAAEALAEGLRASKSLEQLRLRKNRIGDAGAAALAAAAAKRLRSFEGSLLELDLAENKVGDQGALELLRAARFAPPGAKVEFLLNENPVTRDSLSQAAAAEEEKLDASDRRLCFEFMKEGAF